MARNKFKQQTIATQYNYGISDLLKLLKDIDYKFATVYNPDSFNPIGEYYPSGSNFDNITFLAKANGALWHEGLLALHIEGRSETEFFKNKSGELEPKFEYSIVGFQFLNSNITPAPAEILSELFSQVYETRKYLEPTPELFEIAKQWELKTNDFKKKSFSLK